MLDKTIIILAESVSCKVLSENKINGHREKVEHISNKFTRTSINNEISQRTCRV